MKSGVTVTRDKVAAALASLRKLTSREVLVGIPDEKAERYEDLKAKGEPVVANNAMIGFWMEYGVPSRNIPARPFLTPGVENAQDKIAAQLAKAAEAATRGDASELDRRLHSAGMVAQNSVRSIINAGPPPALSPQSLAARRRRGRTGTVPLIDTGQLRNSITYVIRGK